MPKHLAWILPFAVFLTMGLPGRGEGQGRGRAVSLPDGPGKDIAQASCTKCHGLGLIANAGYSREEWRTVFNTMVDLPADESDRLSDYLAHHFPSKPRPLAVIVPGAVEVSFREWPSPSGPRSLPYGIAVHQGVVWYSESGVTPNTLVRFDPKTQVFQSWAIPGGGGVVRNMMATPEGSFVLAESGVNMIALAEVRR